MDTEQIKTVELDDTETSQKRMTKLTYGQWHKRDKYLNTFDVLLLLFLLLYIYFFKAIVYEVQKTLRLVIASPTRPVPRCAFTLYNATYQVPQGVNLWPRSDPQSWRTLHTLVITQEDYDKITKGCETKKRFYRKICKA